MLKSLIKKQMLESLSFLYQSGKEGKRRSKSGFILYAVLMLYVVGIFGFLFFNMAFALCEPLIEMDLQWLYFALFGTMSTAFGVIGSVFMAYSGLYEAKDNELLLAMPIPMKMILLTRMISLYFISFLFEALLMIPCGIVYHIMVGFSALSAVFFVFTLVLLPLLALVLSCILGWVIALIAPHVKNKSVVTIVLTLAFLGGYFYVYSQINALLQLFLFNIEEIGVLIRRVLFFLYHMGLGITGEPLSFLVFAVFVLVCFSVMYYILSRSFLRLVTTKRGTAKIAYKHKEMKVFSSDTALYKKELKRLFSTPTYLLNCGLGSLFLLVGGVAAVFKGKDISELLIQIYPGMGEIIPLLLCVIICMIASLNMITAPSISLEGKSIWILQSLPVSYKKVFWAKIKLHLAVTSIPALFCMIAFLISVSTNPLMGILITILVFIMIMFHALIGLVSNLRFPNLKWTNETMPVKQGMSVFLAMMVNMGVVLLLGALYMLLAKYISSTLYLCLCILVVSAICAGLWSSLCRRGTKTFGSL